MLNLTNKIDNNDTINSLQGFTLSPISELFGGSICIGHNDIGFVFSTIEEETHEILTPLKIAARRIFSDYNNNGELTIFTSLDGEDY